MTYFIGAYNKALYYISCGTFLINYEVVRAKIKQLNFGLVLSYGMKTNNNERKCTNGDYSQRWVIHIGYMERNTIVYVR